MSNSTWDTRPRWSSCPGAVIKRPPREIGQKRRCGKLGAYAINYPEPDFWTARPARHFSDSGLLLRHQFSAASQVLGTDS